MRRLECFAAPAVPPTGGGLIGCGLIYFAGFGVLGHAVLLPNGCQWWSQSRRWSLPRMSGGWDSAGAGVLADHDGAASAGAGACGLCWRVRARVLAWVVRVWTCVRVCVRVRVRA